jgi:Protein O-mannosyl-transferase TMEM260-like
LAGLVTGFFAARVAFELWPAQAALATWPGAASVVAATTFLAWGLHWLELRASRRFSLSQYLVSPLPLLLLALYVFWPRVDLLAAGVLFGGTAGLILALFLLRQTDAERSKRLEGAAPAALAIVVLAVYLRTMGQTVGTADTFEFQVIAPILGGPAHPTGYPLLTLIGKLFSLIPIGAMAWRVNLVSVVFAALAVACTYFSLVRLTGQRGVSALAALALAFSRVFWSQAVQVEVYPLNATFVTALLWLLIIGLNNASVNGRRWLCALAAVYGLSFTNHLTMALMAPAIALGVLSARPRLRRRDWLLVAGCFLAPLALDLYIPLRWPALHNGEWMSLRDFVIYITGQRFGGAMQWGLWREATRWRIVGGLMLDAFGPGGAALAALGLVWLVVRKWRAALVTAAAWAGYFAYGLVYNVPDVSVFIIPAHIIMALWIGVAAAGLASGLTGLSQRLVRHGHSERTASPQGVEAQPLEVVPSDGKPGPANGVTALVWTLLALLPLCMAWTNGPLVDQSNAGWDLYHWGKYVMDLPMPTGSAILADSEKIAPLYYLQRIENIRPRDLDTLVLGDEGAYRAELDRRVAAGQPVYLARYLPGIAGTYRLHSLGPLVRVQTKPITAPPPMQRQLDNASWGGGQIALLGLDIEHGQDDVAWRVTLYWQAQVKLDTNYHVRLRWVGPSGQVWWQDHGAHPVGGYNPTTAWLPGEIVADYHEIPADATIPPGLLRLEVGLFLPFRYEGLERDGGTSPWLTLALLDQLPSPTQAPLAHALRASFGDELLIAGASDAGVLPAGEPASIVFEWARTKAGPDRTLKLYWVDAQGAEVNSVQIEPYAGEYPTSQWPIGRALRSHMTLPAPSAPGTFTLRAAWMDADGRELPGRCGWLAPVSRDCSIGTLRVEGEAHGGGVNFDNQALLLEALIGRPEMRPNETLDVNLKWQGLRQWNANYTAFVHLIGPDGKLHGQVDRWPIDGTLPTTDWAPGRMVDDAYRVPLAGDAPPGTYQVEVGWYLLATLRRLPVVDAEGRPVDDHAIVGEVIVRP